MAETPCQKCKRERGELALKVAGLEAQLREESELTSALKLKERVAELEATLRAQAGNHRYRKEAAELRMARDNEGRAAHTREGKLHARIDELEEDLSDLRKTHGEHVDARFVAEAQVRELKAVLAKRQACVNCGPCPCTEPD